MSVVEADGVTVRRGELVLLDRLDLTVGDDERWVVLGPNGAGKSTLLGLLSGRSWPSAGRVRLLGAELGRVDVRDLWPRIGTVAGPSRPPALSARTLVLTGATGTPLPPLRWQPDADLVARADALLAQVGLTSRAGASAPTLSTGELRRALLARALLARPELLLLDEPAAGLDLPGREDLVEALDAAEGPRASLLVTHHVEEVPARTTHALLLREGRVVAAGPVDEVLADDPLSACFGRDLVVRRDGGRWSARRR